jgi:glycosyltransferase involved in cell wall biosynthesis
VIVPCHNSEPFLTRTLAALLPQVTQFQDVELILVDNNSTDNTFSLLQEAAILANQAHHRVLIRILSATHGQGVNVARNFGAKQALGDFLLFTDHDDAVQPGWLAAYREAFATGIQLAAGPYTEKTNDGQVVREVDGLEYHHWSLGYGLGSNCGITKSGFEKIGGFQPQWIGGGDDADFFWRTHFAGLELVFLPDARIDHYLRDSHKAAFRQYLGYGQSAVRLYSVYRKKGMPRSSTLRALLAWPLVLGELAGSFLGFGSRRRALARLGVRLGRLSESVKLKVRYL